MGTKAASFVLDTTSGYIDLGLGEGAGDSVKAGWGDTKYGPVMGAWTRDVRAMLEMNRKHGIILGVGTHIEPRTLTKTVGFDKEGKPIKDKEMIGWQITLPGKGDRRLLYPFSEVYLILPLATELGIQPARKLFMSPHEYYDFVFEAKTRAGINKGAAVVNPTYDALTKLPRTTKDMPTTFLIAGQAGFGKAQPLTSKFLTPQGWKENGSFVLGDKILGRDGYAHHVTGVFPQGKKEVFELTFSDGSKTHSTDDHLWVTKMRRPSTKREVYAVRTLKTIRESLNDDWGASMHTITLTDPITEFQSERLLVDSYALGILLGDGGFSNTGIVVTNENEEILEALRQALPPGTTLKHRDKTSWGISNQWQPTGSVNSALKELGLKGCLSIEKFIPKPYLLSSVSNRLALLQGLLDTDGYTNNGIIEYSTSSKQLADDVQFLVWSLGGTATRSVREHPSYSYRGEQRTGQPNYRIFVLLPAQFNPFRLQRKALRWRPHTKYFPRRILRTVVSLGMQETQCISTSAPDSCYLTDDMIVTHNTTFLRTLPKPIVACDLQGGWPDDEDGVIVKRPTTLEGVFGIIRQLRDKGEIE